MIDSKLGASKPRPHLGAVLLAGLTISLATCGCLHHKPAPGAGRENETTVARLTTILTGPAAPFLTNGGSFAAEWVMTPDPSAKKAWKLSGHLFGRNGKLCLETEPAKSKTAAALGVIWDAASGQGYVYSDALQGYAPLSDAAHFTDLVATTYPSSSDRFDGHPVDRVEANYSGADGAKSVLRITRATDLNQLPLQISWSDGTNSLVMTLIKIQTSAPEERVFLPPDGFTKYNTQAALLDELTDRQQSVYGGGGRTRGAINGDTGGPGAHSGYDRGGNW